MEPVRVSVPSFEFAPASVRLSSAAFYARFGKRALDLGILFLLAPLVLVILALILAATAIDGGRPLYVQDRIGVGGRRFRCWKVRTMVLDADAKLARILAEDSTLAAEWARDQKLSRDPRITRIGRLLRRTSLDELPQLWNVLTGDMSLVGPRPFLPEQAALYEGGRHDVAYYRVRPGITGLWQVSRRNAGTFAERADYDHRYARDLSLPADLAILLSTVRVVLRATGK